MKIRTSDKYKSYGPIPQNEYTNVNPGKSADTAAVSEYDPQPDGAAYPQRPEKRQATHPSGLKKSSGWALTWKTNGWRAESASQDDESTSMGRYSDDV